MKAKILLLVMLIILFNCQKQAKTNKYQPTNLKEIVDTLSYKVYKVENGWGYDILLNSKVIIHQPFIPAVQGYFPFKTKTDAQKTAKLVIHKLLTQKGLPTITIEELDSLGVLYEEVKQAQQIGL